MDVAIHLPPLLGRTDRVVHGYASRGEAQALVTDLERGVQSLYDWLADFHGRMKGRPYELRPIAEFKLFYNKVKRNKLFPYAYSFPSFMKSYVHALCWIFLCAMYDPLLRVLYANPEVNCIWSLEAIACKQFEHMEDLCKTLPYFCSPSAGSLGIIKSTVPIRMVMRYFSFHKMVPHIHWSLLVAEAIYSPTNGMGTIWLNF